MRYGELRRAVARRRRTYLVAGLVWVAATIGVVYAQNRGPLPDQAALPAWLGATVLIVAGSWRIARGGWTRATASGTVAGIDPARKRTSRGHALRELAGWGGFALLVVWLSSWVLSLPWRLGLDGDPPIAILAASLAGGVAVFARGALLTKDGPGPMTDWYTVTFDDEGTYWNVRPSLRRAWTERVFWDQIERVGFKTEGAFTSDVALLVTAGGSEVHSVPTEAEGGPEAIEELVRLDLFPADDWFRAATATDGTTTWGPPLGFLPR